MVGGKSASCADHRVRCPGLVAMVNTPSTQETTNLDKKISGKGADEMADRLDLVVAASYKGAVGFGEVFDCEVRGVLEGAMDEPRLLLTVLAGDKEKLDFISKHLRPAEFEVGFRVNRRDEPYAMSPISGFVDKARTSWIIEFVREAKG